MQAYSNPKRESDPYSLPDVEVFYVSKDEFLFADKDTWMHDLMSEFPHSETLAEENAGFYYWYCLPGCLPDSDPCGPFESEEQALQDAQSESWQFDDDSEELDIFGDSESCPICSGNGIPMGSLGTRLYYRCESCGMEFST